MSKAHMMGDLVAETYRVNSLNFDLRKVPATTIVRDYYEWSKEQRAEYIEASKLFAKSSARQTAIIENMTVQIEKHREAIAVAFILCGIGWGIAIVMIAQVLS